MPPQPPDLPAPPPPAPAASPPAIAAAPGPLSAEHLQELTLANQRAKKLRSAAGVAMFNGVCIGAFSAFSLLFAAGSLLFGEIDWWGGIMAAGLGAIAWNEFRGRRMLQQFHPRGPHVLGWNQLALLALVVVYAGWMLCTALLGANPYEEVMRREPETAQVLGDIGGLYKKLSALVYGVLILVSLIFQGLNALYYFTRAGVLRGYLADTPAWVVELQRCQAASSR